MSSEHFLMSHVLISGLVCYKLGINDKDMFYVLPIPFLLP